MSLPLSVYRRMPKGLPLSVGFKRYALSFDGSDDYVEVPDSPRLDITDKITVEGLFYWLGPSTVQNGVRKDNQYLLFWWSNTNYFYYAFSLYINGGWHNINLGDISSEIENRWTHWVGVYDGSEMRLYINNALKGSLSVSGTINTTTNPLQIGREPSGNYFNGYIAFARIYNRVLSESEIRYNMLNYHNPIKDGLVLWLYDRIIGSTWYDDSGYGNNGSINGATKKDLQMWEIRAVVGL